MQGWALDVRAGALVARTVAMDSLRVEGLLRLRLPGSLVLRCSERVGSRGSITVRPGVPVATGFFHLARGLRSGGTVSWIRSGRRCSAPVGDFTRNAPQASGVDSCADSWWNPVDRPDHVAPIMMRSSDRTRALSSMTDRGGSRTRNVHFHHAASECSARDWSLASR